MNEDIYACEMIQRNIKSSKYKVNILANNLEKYQTIILEKMRKQKLQE